MKIYTRTGDDGSTGLIGGRRVQKNDKRLDCYGTVDELNAVIGLAVVAVVANDLLRSRLAAVQEELFVIGSYLAAPTDDATAQKYLPPLAESAVATLEAQIDEADGVLPALRNFILPGGTELAARLHVARTVCRRAERLCVEFAGDHPTHAAIVTYLNRLSDWLFVQARLANHLAGVEDVPWRPRK